MSKIEQSYLVKRGSDQYETVASKWDGVKILSIDGLTSSGKAVNIYTAQWIDAQEEDYMLVGNSVITENVNIDITFIVSDKYSNSVIDVRQQHDAFINYIKNGAFYLKSLYDEKESYCVCLDEYAPTNKQLQRELGGNWIMGTISLHNLNVPTDITPSTTGHLYIGFGGATLQSESDILSLTNLNHYETDDNAGDYTATSPASVKYMWICTTNAMGSVTSSGFEFPINSPLSVDGFRCYRSGNSIAPNVLIDFTITI